MRPCDWNKKLEYEEEADWKNGEEIRSRESRKCGKWKLVQSWENPDAEAGNQEENLFMPLAHWREVPCTQRVNLHHPPARPQPSQIQLGAQMRLSHQSDWKFRYQAVDLDLGVIYSTSIAFQVKSSFPWESSQLTWVQGKYFSNTKVRNISMVNQY